MRRLVIVEGVQQVINAIHESNILKTLRVTLKAPKSAEGLSDVMASLRTYSIAAHSFNSSARKIASILSLSFLESPKFWAALGGENSSRFTLSAYEKLVFATQKLPAIVQLLEREYSNFTEKGSESNVSNGKEMKVLSVTIFESGNRLSSPKRLVNVLESVNCFYTACAYIQEELPDTLGVIGCDSGSDKTFDFLGVAKVIEGVAQIIENLWDGVVFYREKQLNVRLDLIKQTLPIYEKILEREATGKIAGELAERLRNNISEGVNKFVESGASIPEIEARSTYNFRAFLSPMQQLLVSAPEEMVETEAQKNQSNDKQSDGFDNRLLEELEINNFSDEQENQLSELVIEIPPSEDIHSPDSEEDSSLK
jgi:hypothetical protein